MYTDKELKKMPRAQMLEAMREMNHPYTTKMDAKFDTKPFDTEDDGSTIPLEEQDHGEA
tara:strand:+ start:504 stop:680 length:177 start_codon:yes stop_codon:yes gene_type:complete